ncbi:MAG: Zn-dependent hydrolase, partial [Myxococcales bacterium]
SIRGMTPPLASLRIDPSRLWHSLMSLAEVGAYIDERTGLRGVNRLALTDADGEGRRLVKRWFEEAGLEVRIDRIGNCYGRRPGRTDAAPVLMGSHIDSVPTAGAFDGCLGVLGGLEVIRTLNAHGIRTERPVEVAFFTDEEGCRFGTDMLGSAVAVGRLPLEEALAKTDKHGRTVAAELARIGFLGDADERLAPPHAFLECHIEQGPVLRAADMELGVVTGVQAISWWELTLVGKSAHAGTTPMSLRRDASVAAARLLLWLHEAANSGRFGSEMRATMGGFDPVPGLVNIVPGRVRCTVDLRNPDDALMAQAEHALAEFLDALERETGVTIEKRQTARTPRIHFSSDVQAILSRHMDARGLRWQRLISGAGHDAQELASLCPAAMIFVPGEYDGISHNPREYSTPEACARGVDVLLQTLLELAG